MPDLGASDSCGALDLRFAAAGCNHVAGSMAALEDHGLLFYGAGPNVVVAQAEPKVKLQHDKTQPISVVGMIPTRRKGSRVNSIAPLAFNTKSMHDEGEVLARKAYERTPSQESDPASTPRTQEVHTDAGSVQQAPEDQTHDKIDGYAVFAALSDGGIMVSAKSATVDVRTPWSAAVVQGVHRDAEIGTGTPASAVCLCPLAEHALGRGVLVFSVGMDARLHANHVSFEALRAMSMPRDDATASADEPVDLQAPVLRPVASSHVGSTHFLPECLAARRVSGSCLIVVGGTDRSICVLELADDEIRPVGTIAGHRDWIRSLAFSKTLRESADDDGFLLASGSTDATARVWRFTRDDGPEDSPGSELEAIAGLDESNADYRARTVLSSSTTRWSVAGEALITDHADAVMSVVFAKAISHDSTTLVTSSTDGSVAMSQLVTDGAGGGRWEARARFGILGGAGAHAIGFCGASFANSLGDVVVAHSLSGGIHVWRKRADTGDDPSFQDCYVAESSPGGHIMAVNSVAWDPSGRFLASCGEDKTTRVFAETLSGDALVEWARPQVHGHPVRDLAFLHQQGLAFASVSEEKVIRTFDAPGWFTVPGLPPRDGSKSSRTAVPELGLSNKAVVEKDGEHRGSAALGGQSAQGAATDGPTGHLQMDGPADLSGFGADSAEGALPLEIDLRQNCLWPERSKLYGHGNDLNCIDVDIKQGILASAGRSQAAKDSGIFVWSAETGAPKSVLHAHDLTVNELRFSRDGRSLLSVSRDRSFAIHDCTDATTGDELVFRLRCRKTAAHTRLIYSAAWVLQRRVVATGSRDKHLKIWNCPAALTQSVSASPTAEVVPVYSRKFAAGVSAVDAIESWAKDSALIAVGLDDGVVHVMRVALAASTDLGGVEVSALATTAAEVQCSERVTCLRWKWPTAEREDESDARDPSTNTVQLAVASEDCAVRVYHLRQA